MSNKLYLLDPQMKELLRTTTWVDMHTHTRDWSQSNKDTVKHALELAYASGGSAIAAMPNTDPALTTLELCRDYLSLARDVKVPVQFYVHIGLTSDTEQVKRAVEAYHKEPDICGMKMFFGRSTGNLGVIKKKEQRRVIKTLAEEGYKGILASHFEKESLMDDKAYNSKKPITWSEKCRPEAAEIKSFCDALRAARDCNFEGTIHVAHVSTVNVADFIYRHKEGPVKLSCGITPHHAFLSNKYLKGKNGAWYKCNPPLRSEKTQEKMLDLFLHGKIPIIESDHAPHTKEDKKYKKARKNGQQDKLPASGITSGVIWPYLKGILIKKGMQPEMIREAMFDNAVRLYNLEDKIEPEERKIDWDALEKITAEYPHDPFDKPFREGVLNF